MKTPRLIGTIILAVVILAGAACSGGAPAPGEPEASGGSPPGAVDSTDQSADAAGADPPAASPVEAVATHVALSPQALIQAERLMCVCGCGMVLAECTCEKEPGSVVMKRHLQSLVDRGLTPSQVTDAMVEEFGPAVLP